MAARWFVLAVLVSFAMFLTVVRAHADALPLPTPVSEFAGSVLPSGPVTPAETRVRMISETVTVAIANSVYEYIWWEEDRFETNCRMAHVEATFVMRNLSDNDEHIHVGFPAPFRTYDTFKAWINGVLVFSDGKIEESYESWPTVVARAASGGTLPVPATRTATPIKSDESVIEITGDERWAKWPASFPAHKDVVIRVEYDLKGKYGYYFR